MLSNLLKTDWNWFLFFIQIFEFSHFSQPNCLYSIYLMQNLDSKLWTSTNCKFDIHKNWRFGSGRFGATFISQFKYKITLSCTCKVRALSSIEFDFRLILPSYGKNLFKSEFIHFECGKQEKFFLKKEISFVPMYFQLWK